MALHDTIEQTVTGLGYDLVDIERTTGGLLRVTIDMPYVKEAEQFINAEDCEKITRQLQFVLEVEGTEYSRLEVSSPGIDRPLRTEKDFERFAGELIDITLKHAVGIEAAAGTTVSANQKKFRGTLEHGQASVDGVSPNWQIVWSDEIVTKPGQKIGKNRVLPPLQALGFTLSEVAQARLAPVVDFKGRKPKAALGAVSADAQTQTPDQLKNVSERPVK